MDIFGQALAELYEDRLLVNRAKFLTDLPDVPLADIVMTLANRLDERLNHVRDMLNVAAIASAALDAARASHPKSMSIDLARGLVRDVPVAVCDCADLDPVDADREGRARKVE